MNIKEFKTAANIINGGEEIICANEYYFDVFYYDSFVIGNLTIKEGMRKNSNAQTAKETQYFEGTKRISPNQFKNRIKSLSL